jgi:hypothetical protein
MTRSYQFLSLKLAIIKRQSILDYRLVFWFGLYVEPAIMDGVKIKNE